eukprot:CAMPEP_0173188830 /NCGR_PEP_ID=MMETSP1141-20130122/11460_1 /TAXON_ID=483371 /ORGANISM="non described non described, Strain CCMP2298" /LENGTH=37 /DNA_ID= /DNA_START= /DNA_END= /DNA_ORIENTATION=
MFATLHWLPSTPAPSQEQQACSSCRYMAFILEERSLS